MNETAKTFLFDLLNTPSPIGFETAGQRKWAAYVRLHADAVESDSYGSAWATLHGTAGDDGLRLMFEAHADEIGFMVNHITEKGFLTVVPLGGSDRAIARGRRVRVLGDHGEVPGVIGITAIHLRGNKKDIIPEWHAMYIDVGASSQEQVTERGVRVGHPVVFAESVEEVMPGRLVGRALDNRIGGFIIAQVVARLAEADTRPAATVYAVNAVQEEIGGHGAQMIAYRLAPDVAVVLDVTHATDTPGLKQTQHGDVKLGAGPALAHGAANHPRVVERLIEAASTADIPIQHEATARATGTDTDLIFTTRSGVPSALVSLPMRYMHSTIETVALEDVERCIELLTAFARSIKEDDVFRAEI